MSRQQPQPAGAGGTSQAHLKSRKFVIDPIYSGVEVTPQRRSTIAAGAAVSSSSEHAGTISSSTDDPDAVASLQQHPANGKPSLWLYGDGELESYRLAILRSRAKQAKLNVYYPGKFYRHARRGYFRSQLRLKRRQGGRGRQGAQSEQGGRQSRLDDDEDRRRSGGLSLPFCSNGAVTVHLGSADDSNSNMVVVYESEVSAEVHSVLLPASAGIIDEGQRGADAGASDPVIVVEVSTAPGSEGLIHEPPCLGFLGVDTSNRSINTSSSKNCGEEQDGPTEQRWEQTWEWRSAATDGDNWTPCRTFPDVDGCDYPHLVEDPEVVVQPKGRIEDDNNKDDDNVERNADDNNVELYDFGVELLGRVVVTTTTAATRRGEGTSEGKGCCDDDDYDDDDDNGIVPPILTVGESIEEATNVDSEHFEQSTEMMLDGSSSSRRMEQDESTTTTTTTTWISAHLLAFRYVCVTLPPNDTSSSSDEGGSGGDVTTAIATNTAADVSCRATFHPTQYRGAFACSDPTLTRIWMSSSYTLRLCMHDSFIVDGIKRDRLPWTGDLAVSLLANAHVFGDGEVVRRSLTVLGRAGIAAKECGGGSGDVNGIVDYSLWWVVCQDLYQRYFDDKSHLEREWGRINAAMSCLIERCDDDGLLKVDDDDKKAWVFIDWVDVEKATALQILWWWTLGCAASLAGRVDDTNAAERWKAWQGGLGERLVESCWDDSAGLWLSAPAAAGGRASVVDHHSRHASILAIASGLGTPSSGAGGGGCDAAIEKALRSTDLAAVGTPYMKFFECLALGRVGARRTALESTRDYWGGMLGRGATTFWEAFDPNEAEGEASTTFYDRPYGRSLCHAWSAGPCRYIPEVIFGIRPLLDGWREWTISPELLGGLEWASATVPTPRGDIEIELTTKTLRVVIPGGTTLRMNGTSLPAG